MSLPQDYAISALTGKPGESGTPAKFIEIEAPSGLVFKNGSPNSITLNAFAVGFTPSAYVWKKNGTTISDQTTSSLTIAKTDVTSSATYSVEADGCKDYATVISVSDGVNGKGISSTVVKYASSTSGTSAPSSGWQDSVPAVTEGNYLWTRTVITYTDTSTSTSYAVARQGANGTAGTSVTITSKSVKYQAGSSGTTKPTGTWSTTVPSVSKGQYLWTQTIVNYSDGQSTEAYSVAYEGNNGTSPYACSVSNENFTVATGTDLKPLSETTYSVKFQAYKGSTQLSPIAPSATIASGKFKVSTPTASGFTVAQSTAGTLTFKTATGTAISANLSVSVTVTYDNGSTETKVITISASKTGPKGDKGDNSVTYEIDSPMVFKKADTVTFNFFKVESGVRTSASVYARWYYSTDGSTWTEGTGSKVTGTSLTTTALNSSIKVKCEIYASNSETTALDVEYSNLVTDGTNGARGSVWYTGNKITGTSTTATIFSGSGITDAKVGDMYKNTDTSYTYQCTVAGDASTAKWVYTGNMKGGTGSAATNVYLGNENITLACDKDGKLKSALSTTVKVGAYTGTARVASTITKNSNSSNVTVGTITNGTTSADGSVPLTMSASKAVTAGELVLKVVANSITFYKTVTISVAKDGQKGDPGAKGADASQIGDNLLKNSDFRNGITGYTGDTATFTLGTDALYGNIMKVKVSGNKRFYQSISGLFQSGKTYAYSFYAKADSSVTVYPSRANVDNGTTHTITTSWAKYSGKITATESSDALSFYFGNTTSTVSFALLKLEEGSEATAWCPNPSEQEAKGLLRVTTAPTTYTTVTGGFTPAYRMSLSTVRTESGVNNISIGDVVAYSYYTYKIGYIDASYVYLASEVSIRGATGAKGADASQIGENLLHDSKLLGSVYGSTYPYYKYIDNGEHTANAFDGFTQTYCNNSSGTSTKDFLAWKNIKGFTLGDKYTLSFWAKGSGKFYTYWYGDSGCVDAKRFASSDGQSAGTSSTGSTTFTLTSEWKQYWVTWQLNTTGNNTVSKIILFRAFAGAQVYIAGPKFEKGETATAWVPHVDEYKGETGDTGTKTFFSDYARTWTNTNWNTYKTAGYATTWNNSTVEGMRVGDILVITATLSEQGNIIGTVYTQITSVPSSKVDGYYKIGCTTLYGMVGQRGQTGATGGNGTDTWTPVLTSVTRSGNKFTKNLNSADWNAQFYSKEGFKRCFISWKASQTDGAIIVGLNSDPTLNANWSSLDYAIFLQTNGKFDIRESGTTVSVTDNTYTTSTVFRVEFDGTKVNYYKDSILIRNVTRAEGTLLYADSSFYTYNKAIQDVSFGALGEKGADYWVKTEWIDLSADTYNQDTWYPVVGSAIPTNGEKEIKVSVQLNSGTKPSWSTHDNGFSVDFHVQDQRSGWGTTSAVCLKYIDTFNWTKATANSPNVSPVSYTQMTNSSFPVLYLRGGGKYQVSETWACTWSIKTATYTINSQSVSPSVNSRPTPRGTYIKGSNGVSMRSKGAWAASTAYVNDTSYIDVVSYNGSSYACKTSHTSGSTFDSSKWNLLADKGDRGFSSRTIAFRVNYSAFSTANEGEIYVCGYDANGAEADTYGYVIINGTTYYAKGMLNSNCAMNGYMAIQKSGATSSGSPATPVYVFEDGSNTWYQVSNGMTSPAKTSISSKADWIVLAKVHSQTGEGKVSLEPMTPCLLSDINSVIEMKYEGIVAAVTNYTSAQITPYKITGSNGSFSKTALTARYVERGALVLNTNAVTPTSSTAQARMMLFDGTTWTEIGSSDARYNDAILLCAGALPSLAGYYYTLGLATPNICGTYIDTLTTNRAFINEAMINLIRAYDINFKNSVSSYKDSGYVAGDLAISMGKNPKNASDDDLNFNIQSYLASIHQTYSSSSPLVEMWKKEFYTKFDPVKKQVDFTVNGKINSIGGISTYQDIFSGLDYTELSYSPTTLTTNDNYTYSMVKTDNVIYLLQGYYADSSSSGFLKFYKASLPTSDNYTLSFSLEYTWSKAGVSLDNAVYYNGKIYIECNNAILEYNPSASTKAVTIKSLGYPISKLSIFKGKMVYSNYNTKDLYSYDGVNSTVFAYGIEIFEFTDKVYVSINYAPQSINRLFFYDDNFTLIAVSDITGKPIYQNGTQIGTLVNNGNDGTVDYCFAAYGKIFLGYRKSTSDGWIDYILVSKDCATTWEVLYFYDYAQDDPPEIITEMDVSKGFASNGLVILYGRQDYFYSIDNGDTFTASSHERSSKGAELGSLVQIESKYYKDIIIPFSDNTSSVNNKFILRRFRSYNISLRPKITIPTSRPVNPQNGDIWID